MEFSIRMLNIGTLQSFDPASEKSGMLTQTSLGLKVFLQGVGPVPITILPKDIMAGEISFQTYQPFLNLTLKNSSAGKIRDKLGLQFSDFDPKSKKKDLKNFCISFETESEKEDIDEYNEFTNLLEHILKVLPKVKVLEFVDVRSYLDSKGLIDIFNKHYLIERAFPLQIALNMRKPAKYKILSFTEKQRRSVRKMCSYISDGTNGFKSFNYRLKQVKEEYKLFQLFNPSIYTKVDVMKEIVYYKAELVCYNCGKNGSKDKCSWCFSKRYCSPSCQEATRERHQAECKLLKEERQERERREVEAVGDWTFSHVMTFEQYWQKMDTRVHKLCRNIGDSPEDLFKISFDMTHSLKNNKFM